MEPIANPVGLEFLLLVVTKGNCPKTQQQR